MPRPSKKENQSTQTTFSDSQDMLRNAPIGVFTSTPDGRYISVNPALARMYGYDSPEELIESVTNIAEQVYVDPSDREDFIRLMKEQGQVVNHESRRLRRDGAVFWVFMNARAVRDEEGRIVAYQGFTTDITERKQAEETLRQSDERFRTAQDMSPDGFTILRPVRDTQNRVIDFTWVYENDSIARLNGTDPQKVVGQRLLELFPGHRDTQFMKTYQQVAESGKSITFEERYSGESMQNQAWFRIVVVPMAEDIAILAQDITERKMAEEKLRVSVEKYRSLMEQSADMMYLHDLQGNILEVNQAAVSATGYLKEELLNMSAFDLHPVQSTREDIIRQWKQWEPGYSMTIEYVHIRKDGGQIPMEVTPCKVSFGGKEYIMAFVRDIAERKRAREEQEKLQAQLLQAQKMESIGILTGGIAHDFNNLLHAMGGNLELLDKKLSKDHPGKKRIDTIQKSMNRAAQMVKKLLLFSRKADIQTQVLDLNQEIHDASRLLERSIPRMISIELILDENARPINADPIQVEQVLLNLGTNAADAMPEGGRLIIETASVTLDQDFVRTHTGTKPGKYVLMTVSDTGCGMDKETLQHIFDPFFTTKEVGKGTGLGLASVYGIVKAHGGYIICYSEPGQGTAFKIFWPVAEPGETEPDEKQAEQAVSQDGTETILVVDDDDEIRELTSEVLEDSGYRVLGAASGEQALNIFKEQSNEIDLVLMDLNMPGMGGRKCTMEMLSIDPSVKVLVASGYSAVGHGKQASEYGAKDFISKPYQMREILAKIREVLDGEQR